jgi:hypothetical protein
MHVLALVFVFLLARVTLTPPLDPPRFRASHATPRVVVLDEHVRNVLAADWDRHASDPVILERAYCVTFRKDVWYTPDWVWRVTEIQPADSVVGQTPHSIQSFYCSPAVNVTSLHLHPPQTCLTDTDCVNGGTLAWQCEPSDVDRASLRMTGKPFALILCDRNAVVSYEP